MNRSTDRILTTHTGSLPRPPDLIEMIRARENGEPVDEAAFQARVREAVFETVQKQIDAGIDIVSDGEEGKPSYATYVKNRVTGFEGERRVTTRLQEGRGLSGIHGASYGALPRLRAVLPARVRLPGETSRQCSVTSTT
jgi:5-methyltetrahydropteroyltriglutamate--homocysteine methyltransferase